MKLWNLITTRPMLCWENDNHLPKTNVPTNSRKKIPLHFGKFLNLPRSIREDIRQSGKVSGGIIKEHQCTYRPIICSIFDKSSDQIRNIFRKLRNRMGKSPATNCGKQINPSSLTRAHKEAIVLLQGRRSKHHSTKTHCVIVSVRTYS